MVELNSCNRDHCSVARQAENTALSPFMEKVCRPLACAEIASPHSCRDATWWLIQTHLLGQEAGGITLSHSPASWPLSMRGHIHRELLWTLIFCLACVVPCQKYVSETAFPFMMLNLTFISIPTPLSGSFHPTSEMYLKTKFMITHAALELRCETYHVYLSGV